jgi:hypothetical protein
MLPRFSRLRPGRGDRLVTGKVGLGPVAQARDKAQRVADSGEPGNGLGVGDWPRFGRGLRD